MSTSELITLPLNILTSYNEARRIKDLEGVLRFDQAKHVIHRNNLHTHMLRVAHLSYDLAHHLRDKQNLDINPLKAKRLAYYHDDPEVITGDIPTPIKYAMSPIELAKLRKAEAKAVQELATRYFGINPLNQKRRQYLQDQEIMTKKEITEARIVNIADKMEGLCETIHEIRCGNPSFSQILKNYRSFFATFIPKEPLFELVNEDEQYRITLETIPTIDAALQLQPISLQTYKRDSKKFWEEVFDENLPEFYRTWLQVSADCLGKPALFPGWKTDEKI